MARIAYFNECPGSLLLDLQKAEFVGIFSWVKLNDTHYYLDWQGDHPNWNVVWVLIYNWVEGWYGGYRHLNTYIKMWT